MSVAPGLGLDPTLGGGGAAAESPGAGPLSGGRAPPGEAPSSRFQSGEAGRAPEALGPLVQLESFRGASAQQVLLFLF